MRERLVEYTHQEKVFEGYLCCDPGLPVPLCPVS